MGKPRNQLGRPLKPIHHTTTMTEETTTAKKDKPAKLARVLILKPRLRIGNFHHAKGSETTLTVEEFELRKKDGEVELIALV